MPEPDAHKADGEPQALDDDTMTWGRLLRGVPSFLALISIGLVVVLVVGSTAAVAISAVLWVLPVPYEPPWEWFPDRLWHWGTTWLAIGGLGGAVGAWAANRTVNWLEGGENGPKVKRPVLWLLGIFCAAALGLAVYQAALIAADTEGTTLQRKAIEPRRVCMNDPTLPPPTKMNVDGQRTRRYDTNGNGRPDVWAAEEIQPGTFAVVIDTAENGRWPSTGRCVDGSFHSRPEG